MMFIFNDTEFLQYDLESDKWNTGDITNRGYTYDHSSYIALDHSILKQETKPPFILISSGGFDVNTGHASNFVFGINIFKDLLG